MVTTNKESKEFYKMVEKLENKKGPNDLEEQIRVLSFRNETLHNHNEKQTKEIIELREDNKRLAKQVDDYILKLRELGVI
tara:strand:- start:322 stop:561 length:240 start_codon:yes stop_codon:yes gene_type:complete